MFFYVFTSSTLWQIVPLSIATTCVLCGFLLRVIVVRYSIRFLLMLQYGAVNYHSHASSYNNMFLCWRFSIYTCSHNQNFELLSRVTIIKTCKIYFQKLSGTVYTNSVLIARSFHLLLSNLVMNYLQRLQVQVSTKYGILVKFLANRRIQIFSGSANKQNLSLLWIKCWDNSIKRKILVHLVTYAFHYACFDFQLSHKFAMLSNNLSKYLIL